MLLPTKKQPAAYKLLHKNNVFINLHFFLHFELKYKSWINLMLGLLLFYYHQNVKLNIPYIQPIYKPTLGWPGCPQFRGQC